MNPLVPFIYYDMKVKTRRYNDYLRDTLDPFDIPDRSFIDRYRLPKHLVHDLISEIGQYLDVSENPQKIPLHLEVLTALNFYASGSQQRRVGLDAFATMSQAKVSDSITNISEVLGKKLVAKYVRFPKSIQAANIKKNEFAAKYGVPGIVGLIDCTHVAITNHKIDQKDEYAYVNRKGYHSINTQAICDAQLRILAINSKYPGSSHDSYIWDGCQVLPAMQQFNLQDNHTWLFGDSGYALKPYMMVPYRNPATSSKQNYNKVHSRIRNGIERCFGILKSRFRCLLKSSGHLHYSHERAANIIYACATLHNILVNSNFPVEDIEIDPDESIPVPNAEENNSGEENRGFLCNLMQHRGIN